ncbi:MAG: deoxyuridine 5'-triphosphate nucleotidohydrolase [Candidatus Adiutrix intracellularis]|nr:MAG: deoxyuridine 5'-triphosphate nucleotidohydrolase [Candidatus Adiutrix intracellularis]
MRLEFKKVRPEEDADLPLPAWQTAGAAGLDLAAGVRENLTLAPGEIVLVPTGWAMALPEGYEGQVRPRSGLALKTGLTLVNTPGTIDWDYRGEIQLPLINFGREPLTICRGDRVAQLIINKVERPQVVVVSELSVTVRGEAGFGSTSG